MRGTWDLCSLCESVTCRLQVQRHAIASPAISNHLPSFSTAGRCGYQRIHHIFRIPPVVLHHRGCFSLWTPFVTMSHKPARLAESFKHVRHAALCCLRLRSMEVVCFTDSCCPISHECCPPMTTCDVQFLTLKFRILHRRQNSLFFAIEHGASWDESHHHTLLAMLRASSGQSMELHPVHRTCVRPVKLQGSPYMSSDILCAELRPRLHDQSNQLPFTQQ